MKGFKSSLDLGQTREKEQLTAEGKTREVQQSWSHTERTRQETGVTEIRWRTAEHRPHSVYDQPYAVYPLQWCCQPAGPTARQPARVLLAIKQPGTPRDIQI